MNRTLQQRILKVIAALAIVFALLLLFPHATGSHSAIFFWLALFPVIAALLEIPSSERIPAQASQPTPLRRPSLPARFQRPPPSA
jgi:hypothetical protein